MMVSISREQYENTAAGLVGSFYLIDRPCFFEVKRRVLMLLIGISFAFVNNKSNDSLSFDFSFCY